MNNTNGKCETDLQQRSINDRPLFMQNRNPNSSTDLGGSEDAEISKFRQALPQFLAVSIKNILLFVYGMTLGFPTIVIPAIQGGEGREPSDIVLNREEISWFSSINLICVPLGCIFSGALTQPIGKRRAMQMVNLPILASWLLFHFSTRTEHLYAALCLSGLGGGLMEAPVLTYVAEITEPAYRGILSALGSTCVITGVFITFIFGSLLDWRTIAAVSTVFPVISIIALCFVPESPTWLIRERRFREAVKALQWLRGWVPEHKIEAEFNQLYEQLITQPALEEAQENAIAHTKPSKWRSRFRMFRKRSFVVPFLLVAFTFFAGHFSGKTPLQTYAVQIFHTLKAPINKYHATILLGIAEMVATLLCVFLIHFTGKRRLVLVSTIGVGCCFFGTAYYAYCLKIVPGFAVNNVVVNATSIVSKDSIITQDNITQFFESEKHKAALQYVDDIASTTTETALNDDDNDTTLWPFVSADDDMPMYLTEDALNRTIRDTQNGNNVVANEGGDGMNFDGGLVDVIDGREDDANSTTILPSVELLESEDTTTLTQQPLRGSDLPPSSTTVDDSQSAVAADVPQLPSTKDVSQEILLPVPKQQRNYLAWIPLLLLLGAAFFAHLGIRMIPWILIGEVFPAGVRSTASGWAGGLGYIFGFLANKLFLQMLGAFTMQGTFWFYSTVAFTGAIVLYFTLPETEGRTLAEIEAHFSKKSNVNLLKKSCKEIDNKSTMHPHPHPNGIQLDNLHMQTLHVPISPQTEIKIIQLQQSDFTSTAYPKSPAPISRGEVNLAFNDTTHL